MIKIISPKANMPTRSALGKKTKTLLSAAILLVSQFASSQVGNDVFVEAEDYVAFSDADAGNNGSQYRDDDVDIEVSSDTGGGYNLGWTNAGEWLEYSINLEAGSYDVFARVASVPGGGGYSLSLDGNAIGSSSVARTGGWQNWQDLASGQVSVSTGGAHTLRVDITDGGFNLNWLRFDPSDSQPTPTPTPTPSPVSTTVQAENYSSFLDADAGNNGREYRSDDVDIQTTRDTGGGYNVGWTTTGEWLEYKVNLEAGTYDLTARVASNPGGASYTVSLNGATIGSENIASTGGWQNWIDQNPGQVTVNNSGNHTVRVDITSGGFNLNWLRFDPAGSTPPSGGDDDGDGVANELDNCPNTPVGTIVDDSGCPLDISGNIIPLFDAGTILEQDIVIETNDALITRFSDRGRDRHAREDMFQAYDHYLTFYWEDRTAAIEIIDYVAKGGSTIVFNAFTQFPLDTNDPQGQNEAQLRFLYRGINTVAEYINNGAMTRVNGDPLRYTRTLSVYQRIIPGTTTTETRALQIGDRVEFELSQFLEENVPNGRANYYGTTYLYVVGQGLVPWETRGVYGDISTERADSYPIPEEGWLGGETTLPYQYSDEPDDHYMQMATNIGYGNGQPFVEGRRVHHTDFNTGEHDEPGNPVWNEMIGKAGTHYVNAQCSDCHTRNGRASVARNGEPMDKWVFKVGDATGAPDPNIGRVLQPKNVGINNSTEGEGTVSIASWTESNGLRSPNYAFERGEPARFSARIAPPLIGLGLLEAIPESTILAMADENDVNGDGISGKAQRSIDPVTGDVRLGRFGWKAGTSSLRHQIAAALNTDIGVMTSVLPEPDCGSNQNTCGSAGSELSDQHLENLVKYVALLGVRAQRDLGNSQVQEGKSLFSSIGCADCHTPTLQTSEFHPYGELRNQTIHPYSDMLLHDMGEGLADNLGEGEATGAEWRTTPLWGLGLSACVTGGVDHSPGQGNQFCTPEHTYLHDGRARSIEEAILWHGGESEASKNNYEALSNAQRQAVLRFLESL